MQKQNSDQLSPDSINDTHTFAASFAQQRLWFLDRFHGASSLYNIPWVVQLSGFIDIPALQQSFAAIIARHEALRTSFTEQDGELMQLIKPSIPFQCELVDLSAYPQDTLHIEHQRIIKTEANRFFDLKRPPLIRAVLLKLSNQEYILSVNIHHIVSDGWSMSIFKQELASFYNAFSTDQSAELAELPIQYADYAVWQREWLQGEVLEKQLSYWKNQLADTPPLNLPTDHPRPKQTTHRGAREPILLPSELSQSLKVLSQKNNVTLFMTLLAAFQVLLHRYSGQDDIVVGSPIAGRNTHEIEHLIGFFVNSLVLRSDLSGRPSFTDLLSRVRKVCLGAYTHQDVPFEKLVAELQTERDMSRHPVFQVMLVLQPSTKQEIQLPGLKAKQGTVPYETAKFDLTLSLQETSEGLSGTIEYCTDLFNSITINRLAGHFQTLLKGIVTQPETTIAELPLLTKPERHQLLVEWNDTQTDYPKDKCVHQLFEQQAERTPDALALIYERQQLNYQTLNEKSNQLAHYLASLNIGPEKRIGVCLNRGLDTLVALLGILKAGGAYLPLDPSYPKARLEFMLKDASVSVILTHTTLIDKLSETSTLKIFLDQLKDTPSSFSTHNPSHRIQPKNLAYILYTSGSTGKPKGVMMPHRALTNLLNWQTGGFKQSQTQHILQFSSLNFDVSFQEIFTAITTGSCLVLISEEQRRDPLLLSTTLIDQEIEVLYMPFVALQQLAYINTTAYAFSHLKKIITAGEQLHITTAIKQFVKNNAGCRLINQYGPTECHVVTSFNLSESIENWPEFPSIGRPIDNAEIYILDCNLQLVPIGVAGEIHIGGAGLARGYLNRPKLTAEKFITNPFSDDPQSRLYKTGDLARYQPDGNIEFLGRIDNQIKLRGFRIEPGEIKSLLGQYPGINEVIVLVREYQADDKRLLAYLTHLQDKQPSEKALQLFLKNKLPEYMVPSAFILLDKFPLTASGKIDRNALPSPDKFSLVSELTYVAPRSPMEESLADIWRGVLNISEIGIHDNFFEKGGHSILAIQLLVRINKQFQLEFPLYLLFDAPTIAELCVQLKLIQKQQTSSAKTPIKALPRKHYQSK